MFCFFYNPEPENQKTLPSKFGNMFLVYLNKDYKKFRI